MNNKDIINIFLENKKLYNMMLPENIIPYGIFFGGSRFFGLEVDTDVHKSDYEFNIIVSNEDYKKLLNNQNHLTEKIYIEKIHVHFYYIPISLLNYNFNQMSGPEFWLAMALYSPTVNDCLVCFNAEKINEFINNLKQIIPQLKTLMAKKYLNNPELSINPQNIKEYSHKHTYLLICLGSLLNNTFKQDLSTIKFLRTIFVEYIEIDGRHQELVLNDSLINFIITRYTKLILWLNLGNFAINNLLSTITDPQAPWRYNITFWSPHFVWLVIDKEKNIKIQYHYGFASRKPITCELGNFYNKDTNECLGKSYFQNIKIRNETTGELLVEPIFEPNVIWKPE